MKLEIHFPRRPQGQRVVKKLNTQKLKLNHTADELSTAMDSTLADFKTGSSVEQDWSVFKEAVHSSALKVLGPATRNHQDWFDENDSEIKELLEKKHQLLRAHQCDPSSALKKRLRKHTEHSPSKTSDHAGLLAQ